jgi:hypothetical protein
MKIRSMLLVAALSMIAAVVQAEPRLDIKLEPGKSYAHTKWFGPVPVSLRPQVAVWLEDENGRYVTELYVTRNSAKSVWSGGKGIRRPEALPVWSHSRGIAASDGIFMPSKENPLPDAVTGATPKASLSRSLSLPKDLEPGRYRVMVEANESFDYNADWAENLPASDPRYNGLNGQPSAVWSGTIDIGGDRALAVLSYVGHGDPTGKTGTLTEGTDGLTTALAILSRIEATYRP